MLYSVSTVGEEGAGVGMEGVSALGFLCPCGRDLGRGSHEALAIQPSADVAGVRTGAGVGPLLVHFS